MLITTPRVVRISFVSIFLYQVSFVRSDKGFDRAYCKAVGTSRDLARLFERSQDFLGKPEEKNSLASKASKPRGKPRPDTSLLGSDLKTPPIHIEALLSGDDTNHHQIEPHCADRRAILEGSGSPAPPIGPMSRCPSRKRRSSTLKPMN